MTEQEFINFAVAGSWYGVDKFINENPGKIDSYLKALESAVREGHLRLVDRLLELKDVSDHVSARDNNRFLLLAYNLRHEPVVNRLLELDAVSYNTAADKNLALRLAARYGRLDVINRLLNFDAVKNNISVNDNEALRYAAHAGHLEVVNRLLESPVVFSYAEEHVREFQEHVSAFIPQYLEKLNNKITAFAIENPNGVFNISDADTISICCLIIKNTIRTNLDADVSMNRINQLLAIPAIHEVIASDDNAILRLAIRLNKQDLIARFLSIPAVRELAESNNYYQDEMQGNVDLRAVANNPESSMSTLSQEERNIIEKVKNKYAAKFQKLNGVDGVIGNFKEYLSYQYKEQPSAIQLADKETLILPLEWDALQKLRIDKNLSDEQYKAALEAYYKNPYHSSYRYLLKPNPWMHPKAGYVLHTADGGSYATFEEYKPLIAQLWLAASDLDEAPRDGYDTSSRMHQFALSIALINRAHNWDRHRINIRTNKYEEYDDMRGDRPSCFSGVNRRLFQAVHGHSLFGVTATVEVLQQELRSFVRDYYAELLSDKTLEALKDLHESLYNQETGYFITLENLPKIEMIAEKRQQEFFANMQDKYSISADNLYFNNVIKKQAFNHKIYGNNHFLQYYDICGFETLLKSEIEHKIKEFVDTNPRPRLKL